MDTSDNLALVFLRLFLCGVTGIVSELLTLVSGVEADSLVRRTHQFLFPNGVL